MNKLNNKVILLASDQLGKGEKELGEGILETFFTNLSKGTSCGYFLYEPGCIYVNERIACFSPIKRTGRQGC